MKRQSKFMVDGEKYKLVDSESIGAGSGWTVLRDRDDRWFGYLPDTPIVRKCAKRLVREINERMAKLARTDEGRKADQPNWKLR